MKTLKDLKLKYVLTPFDQSKILSGVAGTCNCRVVDGNTLYIADTLYIDGEVAPDEFVAVIGQGYEWA